MVRYVGVVALYYALKHINKGPIMWPALYYEKPKKKRRWKKKRRLMGNSVTFFISLPDHDMEVGIGHGTWKPKYHMDTFKPEELIPPWCHWFSCSTCPISEHLCCHLDILPVENVTE